MPTRRRLRYAAITLLALTLAPAASAEPLHILLTNDDGWDAPGVTAMRRALQDAGYRVTLVAPREQQSGKGGSLNTDFCPGSERGCLAIERHAKAVWSVDGTPADAVRAGLGAILAKDPPDLVVSGTNFGQNLGNTGTQASGTINAALQGLFMGFPAIAVSTGLHFSESRNRFPSTVAALAPTARFTARLIEKLESSADGGPVLPEGLALNINVPVAIGRETVPYEELRGVKFTGLARVAVAFGYEDREGAVAAGRGKLNSVFDFQAGGHEPGTDATEFAAGYITLTVIDGDMTVGTSAASPIETRLSGITP